MQLLLFFIVLTSVKADILLSSLFCPIPIDTSVTLLPFPNCFVFGPQMVLIDCQNANNGNARFYNTADCFSLFDGKGNLNNSALSAVIPFTETACFWDGNSLVSFGCEPGGLPFEFTWTQIPATCSDLPPPQLISGNLSQCLFFGLQPGSAQIDCTNPSLPLIKREFEDNNCASPFTQIDTLPLGQCGLFSDQLWQFECVPSPTPSPTPSTTASPTPSLTPSPTPSPTLSPTPSPTPSPSIGKSKPSSGPKKKNKKSKKKKSVKKKSSKKKKNGKKKNPVTKKQKKDDQKKKNQKKKNDDQKKKNDNQKKKNTPKTQKLEGQNAFRTGKGKNKN